MGGQAVLPPESACTQSDENSLGATGHVCNCVNLIVLVRTYVSGRQKERLCPWWYTKLVTPSRVRVLVVGHACH